MAGRPAVIRFYDAEASDQPLGADVEEVRKILVEADETALSIIESHRPGLEAMVTALLQKEEIFRELTLKHPPVHRRIMLQVQPVMVRLTSWESDRERLASLGTMAAGLAIIFAVGLSHAIALSQSSLPPTEASLSRNPALIRDWADRLLADDPKVRATAEAALVQAGRGSFPLLRRLLGPEHEDLHIETFRIIQRIGPPAIPLLVDLLRHEWITIRRSAVSELIDLVPHTETIQPALRQALNDEDYTVAGDAARAGGDSGGRDRRAGDLAAHREHAPLEHLPQARGGVARGAGRRGTSTGPAGVMSTATATNPQPHPSWSLSRATKIA